MRLTVNEAQLSYASFVAIKIVRPKEERRRQGSSILEACRRSSDPAFGGN